VVHKVEEYRAFSIEVLAESYLLAGVIREGQVVGHGVAMFAVNAHPFVLGAMLPGTLGVRCVHARAQKQSDCQHAKQRGAAYRHKHGNSDAVQVSHLDRYLRSHYAWVAQRNQLHHSIIADVYLPTKR
jgi:hypothetical protein